MSEYFALDSGNFVELYNQFSIIDKFIIMLNVYQFDFLVAFFGFFIVRYLFPNLIIGTDQSLRAGLVFAFFYAIFGLIRSGLLEYKKELDIRSVGSSYYYLF